MKQHSKITAWFIGSFLLPPVTWLLSAFYFKIWNLEEMIKILFRLNIPAYVMLFASTVFFIVHKQVNTIKSYVESQDPNKLNKAQKSASRLPWLFIITLPIYTTIGNFPVLMPLGFIDTTEFILAILIGVPIVFLFAIPFYIQMIKSLEIYTITIPFSSKHKYFSVSNKMTVVFFLSTIGVSVIYASAILGIIHNSPASDLVPVIIEKLSITSIVILALTLVNLYLFKKQILNPLQEIKTEMQKLSNGDGDLSMKLSISTKDELGELSFWFNEFIGNISKLVKEINETGINVSDISKKLNSSSTLLSDGANTQASSTEEVSSLMQEISSNIQQNADNALQTQNTSANVAKNMDSMKKAGTNSFESVQSISEKINIINDIAAQTNILALNASVEAARAGENGRGFSVIAGEIRKLAELSKHAADEIIEHSSLTVSETENSIHMLNEIFEETKKTAMLVEEISISSQEQNTGANQVNNAIQNLNLITQQNALSSEELANHANNLNQQAEKLTQLVSMFRIS